MLGREEYVKIKREYSDKLFKQLDKDYEVYKKSKEKYCIDLECRGCDMERSPELVKAMEFATKSLSLAPLPKAVPVPEYTKAIWGISNIKEEGKTPMRYNDNYASASASIASPKSDTATQRDFLLEELARAEYPKQKELQKVFNLYVDNTPKTYKEMIDIIKAGKYTIDPKIAKDDGNDIGDYHYGPLYGIVWPGPVVDWDGYQAAEVEKTKQYAVAKRVIMTGDAAAGLKAVQDFEAWLPAGKSN